jgi:uncharacterized SAM-binding protein YcdF (DUF218 family)
LYQVDKAPLIILNGGHDPQFSATSSAESMRRFIRALGVPDSDIVLEEESRNTTQNADFTGDIPAATDHEVVPLPGWRKWLPDTAALDGSSRAIKEIVGRLVGR